MKFPVSWKCVLFGVLLSGTALAAAAEEASWKSPGFLVESFIEIAMKSGYSTRQNPVRKWSVPVRYFIVHGVGDEALHRRLIQTQFQELAEITGLSIGPAESEAGANVVVVLTNEAALEVNVLRYYGTDSALQNEPLFRHSMCLMVFATERKGSIIRAVAMIPVDRARASGDLVSCVVEELTHAMGLSNDSPKVFPSIFSRRSSHALLTGLDHLILKMLYDPRVKVGMNEKTVRPILQTIADEYQRDNRFATAEKLAAESGLAGLSP